MSLRQNKYDVVKTYSCFLTPKVESEDKFERIGGSSIGGGTFWGLGALLTKTKVSVRVRIIPVTFFFLKR